MVSIQSWLLLFWILIINKEPIGLLQHNNLIQNIECEKGKSKIEPCGSTKYDDITLGKSGSSEKIKLIYYTDPICSACWAFEPYLMRLKYEYGGYFDITYRMGGLLESWDGFKVASYGISGPKDVAHHWDEMGENSGMSIDGDFWLKDSLSSSYPPSLAFTAARHLDSKKAVHFLRKMRESLFLYKVNISSSNYLIECAESVGFDRLMFSTALYSSLNQQSFDSDLEETRKAGVHAFPTLVFQRKDGTTIPMVGIHPYNSYVEALSDCIGGEPPIPNHLPSNILHVFKRNDLFSTREIAFLFNIDDLQALSLLHQLAMQGKLVEKKVKFGSFWTLP